MSNKQEKHEQCESLGDEAENQRIEEACERLARSVTHREATPPNSVSALIAAMRNTAGYVAVALSVLMVAPVAAQSARQEGLVENSEEDRDDRLEDRADEREDAREARVEEREDFDENAAARAERRQTARTERWEGIRDQAELRNPDQLSSTALDELRTHARREARLRAIRNRAVDANDEESVTRVDAVLEREARRHDVALTAMMNAARVDAQANANRVVPTREGAQR